MLNAILVDDERPALQELAFILGENKHINISGMYTDSVKALSDILEIVPDVVFLDIEMPGINGYAMALEINKHYKEVEIVFVTAYQEYALKAFDINAVDYILKPYHEDRIDETVSRLIKRKNLHHKNEDFGDRLVCCIEKIPVWDGDYIAIVSPADILYCTLENGEILISTEIKQYKSQNTLSELEKKLNQYNFFRCHRSFLVNLDKIEKIVPWFNNTYVLKLVNTEVEVPVSRRHMKEFKKMLNL